jgi:hypothetical protein
MGSTLLMAPVSTAEMHDDEAVCNVFFRQPGLPGWATLVGGCQSTSQAISMEERLCMHGQKMADMVSGLTQKNCSQRPSGSGMRPGVQAKAKHHAAWSRWPGGFGKTQGRPGMRGLLNPPLGHAPRSELAHP